MLRRGLAREAFATHPRAGQRTAIYGSRFPRINKMLMGWVFDLSWSIDLLRTKPSRGRSYGYSASLYQPKLFGRQQWSGARRIGLDGTNLGLECARSASGRLRIVQECKGKWAHEPARLGFRPAGWPLR